MRNLYPQIVSNYTAGFGFFSLSHANSRSCASLLWWCDHNSEIVHRNVHYFVDQVGRRLIDIEIDGRNIRFLGGDDVATFNDFECGFRTSRAVSIISLSPTSFVEP